MRRKVLSDVELRSRHAEDEKLVVEQGTIITPAAMDYIRQHGIELETGEKKKQETMTVAKIPVKEGKFTRVICFSRRSALLAAGREASRQSSAVQAANERITANRRAFFMITGR